MNPDFLRALPVLLVSGVAHAAAAYRQGDATARWFALSSKAVPL